MLYLIVGTKYRAPVDEIKPYNNGLTPDAVAAYSDGKLLSICRRCEIIQESPENLQKVFRGLYKIKEAQA